MSANDASITNWRPTADSFRDLALFWLALGIAASAMLAVRGEGAQVAVIAGSVVFLGAVVTATFGRKRVVAALDRPEHPSLSNWPQSAADQRRLAAAGWLNAAKAVTIATFVGLAGGAVTAVGVGLAGAGFGGAVGSFLLFRLVRRFEREHGVTVLTAAQPRGTASRMPLTLGVAAAR